MVSFFISTTFGWIFKPNILHNKMLLNSNLFMPSRSDDSYELFGNIAHFLFGCTFTILQVVYKERLSEMKVNHGG